MADSPTKSSRTSPGIRETRLQLQRKSGREFFKKNWPTTKRMSLADRLAKLEIAESDLEFLLRLFGPRYSTFQMWKYAEKIDAMNPKRWVPGHGALDSLTLLADHVLHRRYVLGSSRCLQGRSEAEEYDFTRPHTEQLILDLDAHSPAQLASLETRYNAVREIFRPTPLVFRTSRSGGLQLVFFLAGYYLVKEVYARTLAALKAVPYSGGGFGGGSWVEIFPTASMELVRVPLGAHGALLDPETLSPVFCSLPETLEVIREAYGARQPLEDIFRVESMGSSASVDAERATERPWDEEEAGSPRDPSLEKRIWEEGLSHEYPRNKALFPVIRYVYFVKGIRNEPELVDAVVNWFREKNNGLSPRYNADPRWVEDDIAARVARHLTWMESHPRAGSARSDMGRRLTLEDYRTIIALERKLAAGYIDLSRSRILAGLCDLFLYVKQAAGPGLNPTVAMPAKTVMAQFRGWDKNKNGNGYYTKWLEALEDTGTLLLADGDVCKGKCCLFTLLHRFCDGEAVEDHQEAFDRLLGPGKVRIPGRQTR